VIPSGRPKSEGGKGFWGSVNKGLPGYLNQKQQNAIKASLVKQFGKSWNKMPQEMQEAAMAKALSRASAAQFAKQSIAFAVGDWLTSKAYDAVRSNILGDVGMLNSYASDMRKIGEAISQQLKDPQYAEAGRQAAEIVEKITSGMPAHSYLPLKKKDEQGQQPTEAKDVVTPSPTADPFQQPGGFPGTVGGTTSPQQLPQDNVSLLRHIMQTPTTTPTP